MEWDSFDIVTFDLRLLRDQMTVTKLKSPNTLLTIHQVLMFSDLTLYTSFKVNEVRTT